MNYLRIDTVSEVDLHATVVKLLALCDPVARIVEPSRREHGAKVAGVNHSLDLEEWITDVKGEVVHRRATAILASFKPLNGGE